MKSIISVLFILYSGHVFSWGDTGHQAVAIIAESLLTPETKIKVNKILNGQNLSAVSTWADEIKLNAKLRAKTWKWHFINLNEDRAFDLERDSKLVNGNNIVYQLQKFLAQLLSVNIKNSEKEEALKFIVHFMGDLHQPLHLTDKDKGGTTKKILFKGKEANLHYIWDHLLIEQENMDSRKYATSILEQHKNHILKLGIISDWIEKTRTHLKDVYEQNQLSEEKYIAKSQQIIREQIYLAGSRLAKILNKIP